MVQNESALVVLARVPHLDAAAAEGDTASIPQEAGRLIGQLMSFRLLAGTILLLLLMTIIPFTAGEKASTPAPVAATAATSPPPAFGAIPRLSEVTGELEKAAAKAPQMSIWPNPDHPTSGVKEDRIDGAQPVANPSTAIRMPEYNADARARR